MSMMVTIITMIHRTVGVREQMIPPPPPKKKEKKKNVYNIYIFVGVGAKQVRSNDPKVLLSPPVFKPSTVSDSLSRILWINQHS